MTKVNEENNQGGVPTWAKTVTTFGAILVAIGVVLSQANANEKRSLKNETRIDVLRTREIPEIHQSLVLIQAGQKVQNEKLDRVLSRLRK